MAAHVVIEPARYAMTGPGCAPLALLAPGFGHDDLQMLDAPDYMARGSMQAGHWTLTGQYICAADFNLDRVSWK